MTQHFAVCIKNNGYEAALELRKLYEVVPDQRAAQLGQIDRKSTRLNSSH